MGRISAGRRKGCTSLLCMWLLRSFLKRLFFPDIQCRWYNIPPEKPSTKSKGKGKSKQESAVPKAATTPAVQTLSGLTEAEDNQSSAPLNFDTFVPTHDPSLTFTGPSSPPPLPQNTQSHLGQIQNYYESILPPPGNAAYTTTGGMGFTANTKGAGVGTINADEAFNRAIGAMYWCGYWTAMYHVSLRMIKAPFLH